jgi:hypothetical protein
MDKSVNSEADDKSQKSNSEKSVTEFDRSGKSISELKIELTNAQTQFSNLEAKIEEAAESEEFDEADVLTAEQTKVEKLIVFLTKFIGESTPEEHTEENTEENTEEHTEEHTKEHTEEQIEEVQNTQNEKSDSDHKSDKEDGYKQQEQDTKVENLKEQNDDQVELDIVNNIYEAEKSLTKDSY